MNFEEIQTIWDNQRNETLYAIDKKALKRLVEKESIAAFRNLKCLELSAIGALIFSGFVSFWDTLSNNDEYFQLIGGTIAFIAAGWLWIRRRKREAQSDNEPNSLIECLNQAIAASEATIQRGRDFASFFALFVFYGVAIRVIIYGWRDSEGKSLAAAIGVILIFSIFNADRKKTHLPRIENLEALRSKLLDS